MCVYMHVCEYMCLATNRPTLVKHAVQLDKSHGNQITQMLTGRFRSGVSLKNSRTTLDVPHSDGATKISLVFINE